MISCFGTIKCISHFHRCNEYTPIMFRNSYYKEINFCDKKRPEMKDDYLSEVFFLVTRSHDFFF